MHLDGERERAAGMRDQLRVQQQVEQLTEKLLSSCSS